MADDHVAPHEIEWTDAQVSRLWDYYARTPPYSEMYFARLYGHLLLRESRLPLQQPLDILDFGSGPGFMWDHLQSMHARGTYTALDFSPKSVSNLLARAAGKHGFRDAIHISNLPSKLPSGSFDVVMLIEVVEHLNDSHLQATLAEVSRLLKPGGVVLISTPNEEDLALSRKFCPSCGAIFHEWQHLRSWSFSTLQQFVRNYGLEPRHNLRTDLQSMAGGWRGAAATVARLARLVLRIGQPNPHLIAVFQKR